MDDYIKTIDSLAKSYACKDVLVAYDFGKSQYRLNILPEYKANRLPPTEDEKEHYDKFFAELNHTAENLPYFNARYYGIEADDIIAYFTLELYEHYKEVWIISSDRDMFQLLKGNVHIFNIFSRKEITAESLMLEKSIRTHEYMLSRVIQGDSGDNIKGIEGIGEVRGQEISKNHKGSLEVLLAALPLKGKSKYITNLNAGKDILIRNEKLINLSGRVKEVIDYGGKDYIEKLDALIKDYKKYPKIKVPPLPKEQAVNTKELEVYLAAGTK